jgi:hypothetical protein
MTWTELSTAADFRDIVNEIVDRRVEEIIGKRYRRATVTHINRDDGTATVEYNGETSPATVNLHSVQPVGVGEVVLINGTPGNKYIADVLGNPYIPTISEVLPPDDGVAPDAPAGLNVLAGIESAIISWDANTEADMANGWGQYRVEIDDNVGFSSPRSITTSATVHTEVALTAGVTIYVRVFAIDARGEVSTASFTDSATPFAVEVEGSIESVGALPTLPDPDYPQSKVVFLTTDNKLYRSTGSAWTAEVPAVDITGALVEAQIGAGAITETKIGTDAVTSVKIAANAIIAGKIAANAISANEIQADAVTTNKILAGAITAAKIASGTITANEIAALTITASQIAASTITGGKIAAGTITASNIQTDTITANEIAALTITGAEIAALTITASKIAAGTITAAEMAANSITAAKLSAIVMETGKYLRSTSYNGTDYATNDATAGWNVDEDGAEFLDARLRGELQVSRIEATLGVNIATNGGFETNTAGWAMDGGTIARDTGTFDTGVASGKLTVDGTDFFAIGEYTEADPNESGEDGSYICTIRVKFETAGAYFFTWGTELLSAIDTNWHTMTTEMYVPEGEDLVIPFEYEGQASTDDMWIDSMTIQPKGRMVGELTGDWHAPLPDGRSASMPRGKIYRRVVTSSDLTVTAGGSTILSKEVTLSADRWYRASLQADSINMDSHTTQWTLRLRFDGTTYGSQAHDSFNDNTQMPCSFWAIFSPPSTVTGTFSLTGNRSAGSVGGAQILRGDAGRIVLFLEDIGPV